MICIVPIYWLLTAVALIALLAVPELFTYRSVADPALVTGSYLFVPVRREPMARVYGERKSGRGLLRGLFSGAFMQRRPSYSAWIRRWRGFLAFEARWFCSETPATLSLIRAFTLPALSLALRGTGFRGFDGTVVLMSAGTLVIGMIFWRLVERPMSRQLRGGSNSDRCPNRRWGA